MGSACTTAYISFPTECAEEGLGVENKIMSTNERAIFKEIYKRETYEVPNLLFKSNTSPILCALPHVNLDLIEPN